MRIRRRGRSTMFRLRLTSEEMETLQKAAQERDVSLSNLIRTAALKDAAERASAGRDTYEQLMGQLESVTARCRAHFVSEAVAPSF